jgi:membrane fusion protein, multidrug efflux system
MTADRSYPALFVSFCFALALLGCAQKATKAAAPPSAVPVAIAPVELKTVPLTVKAIGNVQAFQSVAIKSMINAQILDVHFKQGEDVKQGQLLYQLDPRQPEADLKRAENNLLHDEAQAKNNRVQADRYSSLLKEGVVAKQDYDQFLTTAQAADAGVEADKQAVEAAKVQLQYTKIYAPISGRAGDFLIDKGNVVKANDTTSLVTINQIEPIFVNFAIPEQQLAAVKKYSAAGTLHVQAIISGDAKNPAEGKLTFIDNAVDPTTGTIKLKGTFENKDRRLWPGQFVDVVLVLTAEPNSIVVPSEAVQTGQQGQYVFVVKPDMTADMRPVTVLRTNGNDSVIASGLRPGEQVITDGQLRVTNGVKLERKNAATSALPAPHTTEPGQ